MTVRVGINGFGRIGRSFTRALLARGSAAGVELVAVNDPMGDAATMAFLLKHDSVGGRLAEDVKATDSGFRVAGSDIVKLDVMDPTEIPWADHGVDVVIESTGLFTARDQAAGHLVGGAKRVIISAPSGDADATICIGVNDQVYDAAKHEVISNASCTTNCLAPVAKVLHQEFGIRRGWMTTIHAYTNDQQILDLPHSDLRRARAAAVSMIPTSTGAAKAVGLVLPELAGKLDGISIRVPTPDVSVVDLVAELDRVATAEQVNEAFVKASEGALRGILAVCHEPLVSIDFLGDAHSAIVDAPNTKVLGGNLVKVLAWYDNEWGYAQRVVDLVRLVAAKL